MKNSGLKLSGIWNFELWRRGVKVDSWTEKNLVTDEGINYILDAGLSSGTPITAWYVAIFNDNHTPAAGDTYAVPGFTESTAYDEATRPAWTDGGVAAKSVSNSASKASFTMNASTTIYGAALVGGGTAATTKGNTAGGGKLYDCVQFTGGAKAVEDDDVLKITVTLTGQDV